MTSDEDVVARAAIAYRRGQMTDEVADAAMLTGRLLATGRRVGQRGVLEPMLHMMGQVGCGPGTARRQYGGSEQ